MILKCHSFCFIKTLGLFVVSMDSVDAYFGHEVPAHHRIWAREHLVLAKAMNPGWNR